MLKTVLAAIAILFPLQAMGGEPTPEVKGAIQDLVVEQAKAHGISPTLAMALVEVESGYDARATGDANEIGLMQIKCASAKYFGFKGRCSLLYHVATNLRYGMMYLAKAKSLAKGDVCGTLSRYNGGLFYHGRREGYCRDVKRAMQ
jgi:soluble lytic murein transglycosylase-like protein